MTNAERLAVDLDGNVSSMLALLVQRLGLPAEEVVAAGLRLLVASLATSRDGAAPAAKAVP
jgi:hypothetical protein